MLEKESTLKVCRDIVQNAKCDMDKFNRISMYYYFLTSAFDSLERHEKEYNSLEYGSKESEEIWEKVVKSRNRIYEYVSIIAIESQL